MANTYDLGAVTSYAIAVEHGYEGTEAQFAEELTGATAAARAAAEDASDAEAYAVGKRGGVDVGSTDPAYHNNAKYWAENASGTNLAQAFSTSTAYAVGDYVLYSNKLYRFTTAHSAGAWNSAQVSEVKTMDEVSSIKGDLSETVKFTAQTLTEDQKAQARENIGAEGLSDDIKSALLDCFRHVMWIDNDKNYYGNLYKALMNTFISLSDIVNVWSRIKADGTSSPNSVFWEGEIPQNVTIYFTGDLEQTYKYAIGIGTGTKENTTWIGGGFQSGAYTTQETAHYTIYIRPINAEAITTISDEKAQEIIESFGYYV